jgi:acyl-CoA reductase-like NAD-dependent aldehyde dehydrogenase
MRMLIDSDWVDSSDGTRIEVRNPATGEVIDSVPQASLEDARRAVDAALRGKDRMARLPAHERADILFRTAWAMEENLHDLARLLAGENGKPLLQTTEEVRAGIRIFWGFGEEAKRVIGRVVPMDAVPGMERHLALAVRQPVGVVAAIVPFNYPVELYAHKGAAALAAGNAVIAKPPTECPLTLLRIAEMLEDAGLPRGAHQMLPGPGVPVGEFLASAEGVDLVTVTGSVGTGRRISELASASLKSVHLELGGNDALIVCDDADLEKAAEAVVLGRLARGNGQICCAVKRVLVDAPSFDDLAEILTEKAKALRVGDPLEPDTDVGPLITTEAAERVETFIEEAVAAGATVRAGGHRHDAFVEPTVLTDVPPAVPLFREEVFGPVAPLVPFHTVDEAVAVANDTPYGLQAAVFTNDISRAFDMAYRLQVGGVVVNWSSAVRVENLPFGGVKLTGHGREGLHDTLELMTRQKSILVHDALPGAFEER